MLSPLGTGTKLVRVGGQLGQLAPVPARHDAIGRAVAYRDAAAHLLDMLIILEDVGAGPNSRDGGAKHM